MKPVIVLVAERHPRCDYVTQLRDHVDRKRHLTPCDLPVIIFK